MTVPGFLELGVIVAVIVVCSGWLGINNVGKFAVSLFKEYRSVVREVESVTEVFDLKDDEKY